MEAIEYEKVIGEYKSKFTELDKAIAARDKVIDDLRKKVTEFRNKFYDIQHENDEHIEHIESLRKMNNDNVKIQQKNMNKLKEDFKDKNRLYENRINELQSSAKIAEDEKTQIAKKLDIAQNVIGQLKEKIDEKDAEITNLQHSKSTNKFTSETQTSLADELKNAVHVNKFSKEKKEMLEKFTNIPSKINLQIEHLSKSIINLKNRKPQRCNYGWGCKRKFCRYSHDYLYSYKKVASSICDEDFSTSKHLEEHQVSVHEVNQLIAVNSHNINSKTRKCSMKVEKRESEEESSSSTSSSSSSSVTTSTPTSITSSSQKSSFSVNNSEREEVGGMSLSNSL